MKNLNGVPQGSVLAPIMILVYVNDMIEEVSNYTSLFADDAKLQRNILEIGEWNEAHMDIQVRIISYPIEKMKNICE